MKRNTTTLKTYFETGDYPSEGQFADLIDSFLNIDEEDAVTGITNNGDGTYTFQLLSGGTEILDIKSLPDSIPIATIVGLQALLDGKVNKSGDTMQGDLVLPNLVFSDSTTTFIKPSTNNNNILFIGGNGLDDKNWSNVFLYTSGVFRVNNHDVWHEGNDNGFLKNQMGTLSNLDLGISRAGTYNWGSGSTNTPATYGTLLSLVSSGGDYNGSNNWLNQLAFGTDNEVYFRQKVNADAFDYWGKLWKDGINTKLTTGGNNALRVTTNSGYIEIGPQNSGLCHITTDRNYFWFSKAIQVETGQIRSYNDDLNLNRAGSSTARIRVTNGITYSDQDLALNTGQDLRFLGNGRIRRYSHVSGFLEGSYNTVAGNQTKTNPIYTIGSSYIPNESTLNNMYGIGYSEAGASFLNSSDLGANPSGWGMYVASDGNARIFLSAGSGNGYFRGDIYAGGSYYYGDNKRIIQYSDGWLRINPSNHFGSGIYCGTGILRTDGQFECGPSGADFKVTTSGVVTAAGTITASNFILSSDERLKSNIVPLEKKPIKTSWVSFEMKGEKRYGVIAQELEKQHPEFVRTDEEGYKSVTYIDLLVAKNAELEARINKMEKIIEKLI